MRSTTTVAAAFSVLCTIASAQAETANDKQVFSLGIKYGELDSGESAFSSADNIAISGAFQIDDDILSGTLDAELEYSKTTNKGNSRLGIFSGEWEATVFSLYASYRSNGRFYGKLKAGFAKENLEMNNGFFPFSDEKIGFSGGVGAGVGITPAHLIEAEYTVVDTDLNFISIGYHFRFGR